LWDQRRERLLGVYYALQHESTSYNTLVELTYELINLVQDERLSQSLRSTIRLAASLVRDGDTEAARKYGRASLKFANIFSDADGGFCTGLRRDLELDRKE
jgi:hypothetical protein